MPGYVYLFRAKGTSFFKIGRTNDIKKRLNALQTSCPLKIHYVHAVFVSDPAQVEKSLHKKFSDKKEFLEWFVLSIDAVKECCSLMDLSRIPFLDLKTIAPPANKKVVFMSLNEFARVTGYNPGTIHRICKRLDIDTRDGLTFDETEELKAVVGHNQKRH